MKTKKMKTKKMLKKVLISVIGISIATSTLLFGNVNAAVEKKTVKTVLAADDFSSALDNNWKLSDCWGVNNLWDVKDGCLHVQQNYQGYWGNASRSFNNMTNLSDSYDLNINFKSNINDAEKYLNEKWKYKEITLELVQESEAPSVTRADLESIRDELGSYSTQAGYGDRVKNIRRAAELLNGTLLMPGEELSVEQTLAPYTEENGYVAGSAYENGQVVQNIGGGLCQVSTTLYNAVLYSELEVTERCAHSMIVNYVEPSRDAAIAEGVKDFKFKNNYDTPILIEGYVDSNNKVWFYIYGKDTRAEGHSVEFESETLERTEYSKKYVEDPDSAIGSMEEEGTAINGRTARLWKVVYENGQEVSRDVINNSTYKASEVTVKVGTASGSAEASKLIRTAIQSQNEDKIREAVSEARTLQSGSGEGE